MTLIKQKQSEFENALTQCCSSYQDKLANSDIKNDALKLEQNIPNPFSEKTVIKFYVPSYAINAMINLYTLDGAALKSFAILTKGIGQVEINANFLSQGTYVYHLIIDGKQIDAKLMTITK